jgi:cation transporter-like permease
LAEESKTFEPANEGASLDKKKNNLSNGLMALAILSISYFFIAGIYYKIFLQNQESFTKLLNTLLIIFAVWLFLVLPFSFLAGYYWDEKEKRKHKNKKGR